MKENKYDYAREMLFNLRSCYAIDQKVYLHWLEKIDNEQKLTLQGVSKSVVCGNCNGWGYTVDENGRRKEHCKECE